jgi:hypothetical protein
MKFTVEDADWMVTVSGAWLMLKTDLKDATRFCGEEYKKGKTYDMEIKEHRNKRSLDANAYCWTLLGKIANKVGIGKDEVYRKMIRDVGDNYTIVPIRNDAVETWVENWQSRGVGWVCDNLGDSKIDGYTNIATYYGSSTYDTKQMSALINLVVQECKTLGIETATPAELSLLLEGWGGASG